LKLVMKKDTLAERVGNDLRQAITSGGFSPGDKLPSEAQLTQTHGVSRTVVRRAIADLRAEGLVEARQGAGVFVIEPPDATTADRPTERARLAQVLEILEVRTPLEIAAAGLAAQRRSPAQEEHILDCHATLMRCIERGESFREADFALHLAIAEATNNPQFASILKAYGKSAVPRSQLITRAVREVERSYHEQLIKEHQDIVLAISRCDREAAQAAMQEHLVGSQARHRDLLQWLRTGQDMPLP
jgi:GntR family transcriptional regulator, transcriptional repressor for pyruvate dehydrogenase complex